ncbi:MAG: tetratricopeptide repeat protein [Myxococcales bacterium]
MAGELAMLDKQPAQAAKEFARAAKLGGEARANWGLARAQQAIQNLPDAEAAAKATLESSPRHSAALVFLGELALSNGELAEALSLARKASGADEISGTPARPSKAERARAFALEGRVEERREHPREAQAAYERALAADPLQLDVLIGSARMLMRLGRTRDALTRFDSALGANPPAVAGSDGKIPLLEASLGSAQALLSTERAQEALDRINGLIKRFPENYEVHLWHGHALEAQGNLDDAEAAFQKTIELAPQEFGGYVALSQLLFKRERPEEAARTLSDATNKVKDSADVRRMLGNSELLRNHLPEAIHQFGAALQFDPKDAGALFGLCVAQRKHGEISAAEQTLARLAAVDPTFSGLPLERGQLLETRGDYAGAAAAYQKALEERPHDTELKLRLGAALVTADRVDEADALLREVLKERPTSAEAEHFMGRILFARHDTAQALQRFERAVNFDNMRADYHMYLAWAHLEQGNLSGALESVNAALARDPNLADAYWILGRIQLRTGAVKDALQNFQTALRLKPGRVEALAGIGDAYDQLRELSKAIKSYQEAVKLAPEHGDWWYRLGSLHLDKGSRDEARVTLAEAVLRGDRLIEKPSWLADAHHAYAEVLRDSGRIPEALDQYKTFLQLAPAGHPNREEATQILRANER